MNEHPITDLLNISLQNIRDIADVNMVVGDAIPLGNAVVIPICKVKYKFISGGLDQQIPKAYVNGDYPFGGGSGGSTVISPVAFLCYVNEDVKLLHLDEATHAVEEVLDFIPSTIKEVIKSVEEAKKKKTKEN